MTLLGALALLFLASLVQGYHATNWAAYNSDDGIVRLQVASAFMRSSRFRWALLVVYVLCLAAGLIVVWTTAGVWWTLGAVALYFFVLPKITLFALVACKLPPFSDSICYCGIKQLKRFRPDGKSIEMIPCKHAPAAEPDNQ